MKAAQVKRGDAMKGLIRQSVLSGILVGIGVVINASSSNKYIGAMLFSLALLTIIKCGLKLYTGKIGFYRTEKARRLFVMLVFNLAGALIPTLSVALCRRSLYETIAAASDVKFGNSFAVLFLYGALCGVLMFIAVYSKDTIITIFCIMVFILSGYEHCIADFIYLALNFSIENCGKFAVIILGNSAGSIVTHFLIEET